MGYRTLFCGTPTFALRPLERLLEDSTYSVEGVVSQPDSRSGRGKLLKPSPVKSKALESNITVWTPAKAKDPEFISLIRAQKFDLAVVVAYGQILSQEFLDLFPKGCFNLHGSLLPRWRGAAPIQRALMSGDLDSGVCLQKMVFRLDAGDVLGSRRTFLSPELGASDLFESLSDLGSELLTDELPKFLSGSLVAQPQDESQVTYAHKIEKAESVLDWSEPARTLHNKIRGLNMGPFAKSEFRGRGLKIHRTRVYDGEAPGGANSPGTVVTFENKGFGVMTGEGCLEILALQPESKARMTGGDFLHGFQVKEGERFGPNL